MPIRFEASIENNRWSGNRHKAASCKCVSPDELASGNWQQDANPIWKGFRLLKLNRQLANGSQMQIRKFLWIGNKQRTLMPVRFERVLKNNSWIVKWQMAARCQLQIIVNWQLATSSQMTFLFERVSDHKRGRDNRQTAARCQFANSCELATGNWKSDANSI